MPALFPEWFDRNQRRLFGDWLRAHLASTELFLCHLGLHRGRPAAGGTTGRCGPAAAHPRGCPWVRTSPWWSRCRSASPRRWGRFVLVVGTIEPRKNQRLVLNAFDRLSRRHEDLALVLVGKEGWLTEALVADIRAHPEFGRRLLWLEGIDDAELAWLYRNAFLAVTPSRYEGLGVPVMEALHHGCPDDPAPTGGALTEAGDGRVEEIDPDDVDGLTVLLERHLMAPVHHRAAVHRAAGYSGHPPGTPPPRPWRTRCASLGREPPPLSRP